MHLRFASLNSGSNGNCYFVGNEETGILVDVGISAKAVLSRLDALGISIKQIDAIFVSHEHSDHVKGLYSLCSKYQIPVYISEITHKHCSTLRGYELVQYFTDGETIQLNNLSVYCFRKIHDAVDPYSFTISIYGKKVGIFTDLGVVCNKLMKQFGTCDVVFLESNYDADMLQTSSYPYYLKERIRGGSGHLSNTQALELFREAKSRNLSHLFLSHLSKNNNCPYKVIELYKSYASEIHVEVAGRDKSTALFILAGTKQQLLLEQTAPSLYQTVLF